MVEHEASLKAMRERLGPCTCGLCMGCLDRHEATEARVRELEAFKARAMEWARGRCTTCEFEHENVQHCTADVTSEDACPNWTPPQAWEVGE